MDLGYPPPLPMGLISVGARDLAHRASELAATVRPRLPSLPVATVLAAVLAAWLINAADWTQGDMRLLVATSLGSLVASAVLATGWTSEPEELERWAIRAAIAALASAFPAIEGLVLV